MTQYVQRVRTPDYGKALLQGLGAYQQVKGIQRQTKQDEDDAALERYRSQLSEGDMDPREKAIVLKKMRLTHPTEYANQIKIDNLEAEKASRGAEAKEKVTKDFEKESLEFAKLNYKKPVSKVIVAAINRKENLVKRGVNTEKTDKLIATLENDPETAMGWLKDRVVASEKKPDDKWVQDENNKWVNLAESNGAVMGQKKDVKGVGPEWVQDSTGKYVDLNKAEGAVMGQKKDVKGVGPEWVQDSTGKYVDLNKAEGAVMGRKKDVKGPGSKWVQDSTGKYVDLNKAKGAVMGRKKDEKGFAPHWVMNDKGKYVDLNKAEGAVMGSPKEQKYPGGSIQWAKSNPGAPGAQDIINKFEKDTGIHLEMGPDGKMISLDIGGKKGGKDPSALGVRTRNNLQADRAKDRVMLASVKQTFESLDPEFLTYGGQFKGWGMAKLEKIDKDLLSLEDRDYVERYFNFRSKSYEDLNKYLNSMSGAAVTEHEMNRLLKNMQNPDDSYSEYMGKYKAVAAKMELRMRVYDDILATDPSLPASGKAIMAAVDKRYGELKKQSESVISDLRKEKIFKGDERFEPEMRKRMSLHERPAAVRKIERLQATDMSEEEIKKELMADGYYFPPTARL